MNDATPPSPAATEVRRWSGTHLLAFAWGLAEATIFFIVPDVLLTRLALKNFSQAAVASLWAMVGALVGGTALWFAARHGATQFLLNAFDWIPGISRDLIIRCAQSLDTHGLSALASGALVGQPFKLYAVHAGAQGIALFPFVLAAAAARITRFLLTAALASLAAKMLHRRSEETRLRTHAYFWFIFYTAYFVWLRRNQ